MRIPINRKMAEYLGLSDNCNIIITEYYDLEKIEETWNKIYSYKQFRVFDSDHAIEQFKSRFPKLNTKNYFDTLEKGLRKIEKKYSLDSEKNYAIISRKFEIKIPIHIRPDRNDSSIFVGATPTTLHATDNPFNTKEEIEILVEKSNQGFYGIEFLFEGLDSIYFQDYIENGEYRKTYQEIILED